MTATEAHFTVTYDGPDLATGRMPVRNLAPALVALGEVFAEASALIDPAGEPVGLSITATKTGSFDVGLYLEAKGIWDQFVDFFTSDEVTAIAALQAMIIGASYGVIAVLRVIGDKEIVSRSAENVPPGMTRILLDDETTIETTQDVAILVGRRSIRRNVRDALAPLRQPGVDEVRFTPSEADDSLVVSKQDFDRIEEAAADASDVLLDSQREIIVQIASVSFEGKKWRLSDGSNTFWASIEDPDFVSDIERRMERFAQGDMLRCLIRDVQTRRPGGGLKSQHHVLRVIEHMPGDTQLKNPPPCDCGKDALSAALSRVLGEAPTDE